MRREHGQLNRNLFLGAILSVAAFLSCVSLARATEVYKWKDAQGRTHISDRAPVHYDVEHVRITAPAAADDTGQDLATGAEPQVVMLSASWCGVCRRARSWLTRSGVAFTEYDVERDRKGIEQYKRLHGKGVPIILVGNERMDGFSARRLEAMLARARK